MSLLNEDANPTSRLMGLKRYDPISIRIQIPKANEYVKLFRTLHNLSGGYFGGNLK